MPQRRLKFQQYYAPNNFKRAMGYTEPDYLRVAGLYYSTEQSLKSKPFGGFLVKKADYVAKTLNWSKPNGEPDVERAKNAIYRACKTKGANGLNYLYSVSNKDKIFSDKGGARIFMSGPKWNDSETQQKLKGLETGSFQTIVRLIMKTSTNCGLQNVTKNDSTKLAQRLLEQHYEDEILKVLEYLASSEYERNLRHDWSTPQICKLNHIAEKFSTFQEYANRTNFTLWQ